MPLSNLKKFLWEWPDGLVWKLTENLTLKSRKKKYKLFIELVCPQPTDRILDIGVSPFTGRGTNFLELWYPYPENITALTNIELNKFNRFIKIFPKVKLIYGDGKNLNFPNNYFDIVFSNAVIEHVGDYKEQKKFINELCRVGKKIFISTPNYWFPLESHTLIPFVHWFPKKIKFFIYKKLGRKYWADEKNLNLLTAKKLLSLFPENMEIKLYKQRIFGLTANLIVIAKK